MLQREIGDHRLDHLIGQGSSGEVWLGWDRGSLGRPVAIKRVRPGAGPHRARALEAEARLLAGIHHPHLVPILSVEPDDDGIAIVMPYLAGGSLAALLQERGTLDPGEVVALLEPLADAVGALIRRGIVHGDLKPGNVMLTGDGEPVLVDAGLAAAAGSARLGAVMAGTPEYLDPAVAQGGSPGALSEVYSLGVLAYECLTGRLPHRGEPAEVVAVAGAGVHRRLHSWPTVPEAVAEVVESALHPDPDRRPADASALAAELRAAVEGPPGEDPPGESSADPEARARRVRLPGITRSARAAPVPAAGCRTVVVDSAPDECSPAERPSRRRWRAPIVGFCAALVVVLVAVAGSGGSARSGPVARSAPADASEADSDAAIGHGSATSAGPTHHCRQPPTPHPSAESMVASEAPTTAAATVVMVDVDGDGCADRAHWDGHHLTVTDSSGTRAYRLGQPGDQVLFGDWDGDGASTPALYRPSTGEVLYVDRFPSDIGDQETAVRVEHLEAGGTASVRTGTDPHPRDRVELAESP